VLGFAVASPLLFAESGKRTATLALHLDDGSRDRFMERLGELSADAVLENAFSVQMTVDGAWMALECSASYDEEAAVIRLIVEAGAADAAWMAWQESLEGTAYATDLPVLEWQLEGGEAYRDAWYFLHDLQASSVELTVRAEGITNYALQNDTGKVDGTQGFQPFGARPTTGSALYVNCPEAFEKPLKWVGLEMNWLEKPDSLTDWYADYVSVEDQLENQESESGQIHFSAVTGESEDAVGVFTANFAVLEEKEWRVIGEGLDVFGEMETNADEDALRVTSRQMAEPEYMDETTVRGVLRVQLDGPATAFGHAWFQQHQSNMLAHNNRQNAYIVANAIIEETNQNLDEDEQLDTYTIEGSVNLPNTPYTPSADGFRLSYEASATLDLSENSTAHHEWFHLFPNGSARIESAEALAFLPKIDESGTFYIGLDNFTAPQTLNLYFRIAAVSPNASESRPEVQWSALCGETWQPIDLAKDETEQLRLSG
ncbi:MAG: hypothetical protein AAF570_23245, partial [Bacteroidota bacterium]